MVAWMLVLLVAGGCADSALRDGDLGPAFASGDATDLVGRTFLSEAVTQDGAPRELAEGTRIHLEFADDEELRVSAGCNILLAGYSIREERLEVSGVGGTEMGCTPDLLAQDDWLSGFLESSPRWTLADARLTLVSGKTEIVLLDREVAEPDRPLERTRWIVDTIVESEVSSSMHAGTEGSAWLRIDGATFRANTGCRGVSGSVTVERGRLRFTEAIQTDPGCARELEDVDAAMTTILRDEVEFSIDADRLTLIHADGLGLGLHADE